MKDWSKLHKELLDWSEEITNKDVKKEYLLYCIDIISNNNSHTNYTNTTLNLESLKMSDVSKTRSEIINKFSNYIPSLKQELRENRINKILN